MKKALKYIGLFMFGVIAFPILLFLNWKNKDKDYKNYLIASGVGFAFFLIGGIFEEDTETDTSTTGNTEQVVEEPEPEPEPIAEDETEQEEPDEEPEESDEEPEEEEIPYEFLESGIALVELRKSGAWSINGTPSLVSHEGAEIIKEHHEEFDNGIIIANINTLVDQYGNEQDTYTIAVHYSPETIDKINFDNWPMLDAEDLFKTADSVFIHYVIDNEDYRGYAGIQEDAPSAFYNYMGGTAE